MNCLNEPSAPYKGYTYPEPLRTYVAGFERYQLSKRLHRNTPREFSKAIWRFFSRLPKRKTPERIWTTDVEDYKAIRLKGGAAWNQVAKEIGFLRTFFRWCIQEHSLEMVCPVISMKAQRTNHPAEGVGVNSRSCGQ